MSTVQIEKFKSWLSIAGLEEKPHQTKGLKWCLEQEEKTNEHRGGFLCDEMGLGKTILMLGCIYTNFHDHTLIVVPPALLSQWNGIINKFFRHKPLIFHGPNVKHIKIDRLESSPIVLTTYGMLSCSKKSTTKRIKCQSVHWNRVIYDEAHHLRTVKTNKFAGAAKLNSEITWLVTGTPIHNRIDDLLTLCHILGIRGEAISTPKKIFNVIDDRMLRRTKKQIGIQLPNLNIEVIPVEFSSQKEKKLAKDIHSRLNFTNVSLRNVDDIIQFLDDETLPLLVRSRQCCVYPELVIDSLKKKQHVSRQYDVEIPDVRTHSKITAMTNKLIQDKNNGKRKLIFCLFRKEIDKIYHILTKQGISVSTVDGRTNKKNKAAILEDKVLSDVLIVQIQTACEGLNLQQYSEVYFSSPHWNPAIEDQAICRVHRIGQTVPINVYKFICCGLGEDTLTIDQYCLEVQNKKRELVATYIERNHK